MANYRKIIKAGNVIEVEYIQCKRIGARVPRSNNMEQTEEQKKKANRHNAVKKLSRIINANFTTKDLFCTLTFRGKQPTYEQTEKYLREFLRGVRTIRKLRGLPALKYVAVIEDAKRIHIHIVMLAMSIDEVSDLWKHGKSITSRLEPNGEYTGIAHYITKEPRHEHKKRWSQSRNLEPPKVEYEEITRAIIEDDIPTPNGYRKIYEITTYIEDIGLYKYAKFIRWGKVDIAMGTNEIKEE